MVKPIRKTTADEKEILAELDAVRTATGMGDEAFARKYLPFSYSTWTRLKNNNYTGDTRGKMAAAKVAMANLREELAIRKRSIDVAGIHKTRQVLGVDQAVAEARSQTNENRLVFYLAPTEGSKTTICEYIADKYQEPIVEATESWRKSYCAGCAAICEALGSHDPVHSVHKVEQKMLTLLRQRRHVLIIDEGNTFGPHTANMIKLILNSTETTVLVAAIPFLFHRMRLKSWAESSQIIRRCKAIIQCDKLTTDDIAPMFYGYAFDGVCRDKVLRMVTDAANRFGMFDMVRRVCSELAGKAEISTADAESAIIKTMRCISINPKKI